MSQEQYSFTEVYARWRKAMQAKAVASDAYRATTIVAAAAAKASIKASASPDDAAYQAAWDAYQLADAAREGAREEYRIMSNAEAAAWSALTGEDEAQFVDTYHAYDAAKRGDAR